MLGNTEEQRGTHSDVEDGVATKRAWMDNEITSKDLEPSSSLN